MDIKNTPIAGLKIILNKVVSDERGSYCDMLPGGTESQWALDGIKHIHASIATQKLIARGGHYHLRLKENFYTLSGTALWFFYDFKEDSPTHGQSYAVILGFAKPQNDLGLPVYTIDQGVMAQLYIEPGVYHIFWPLTDEKTVVAGTGSLDYDSEDYGRPTIDEVPGAKEIFEKIKQFYV